jgi:ParB-like chromosome segregation protein Spo0J
MQHSTHLDRTSPALADIKIDPVFGELIPPLSDDERRNLEENLKGENGARDPLVVWRETGLLLDGHNRYEICSRLGLGFKVVDLSFPDREAAADWIDRNQLGRRNLKAEHLSLLRGRRYQRAKRQGARTDLTSPHSEGRLAAEQIAQEHGVSRATIERDGQFARAVENVKAVAPDMERSIATGAAPSKSAVMKAAQVVEAEPEKAKAILRGAKPEPSPASADMPWAAFEARMREDMATLRSVAARFRETLEYDPGTKQLRSRWGHYYSHSGTIGSINQLVRVIEDGLPAALSDREAHGYISNQRAEVLAKSRAA